ncbi:MAG: hypothetical protein PHQ66_01550 [Candidatus Nanoarchaeia archaeon]|nr:hypothetical protein [Candidatus Nanoarchaeia archaeon]MDD5357939.1 hypothetical protein [Candidatus Nanoarchaeia archaeon]MDD5588858.1 hypothetical protein [Candidatus Nanoarchaeia archaeon]
MSTNLVGRLRRQSEVLGTSVLSVCAMIPLKFFNKNEKEQFIKQLNEQFGIKDVPFSLAKLGRERIIVFSGDISEKEILGLDRFARIEGIGLYFAKIDEKTQDLRLSIEGVQLMKEQITKNIFELDEKQAEQWMMGQELLLEDIKKSREISRVQINSPLGGRVGSTSEIEIEKGFFIMKFKNDFLGTGKISAEKISNFIPKSRRLKYKEIKVEE